MIWTGELLCWESISETEGGPKTKVFTKHTQKKGGGKRKKNTKICLFAKVTRSPLNQGERGES